MIDTNKFEKSSDIKKSDTENMFGTLVTAETRPIKLLSLLVFVQIARYICLNCSKIFVHV